MKTNKLILAVALCGAMVAFAPKVSAITLAIGDNHELGFINYGIPAGDADITDYLTHLIGMSLGSVGTYSGQDFSRSSHSFSPLDAPVLLSRNTGPFPGNTVDVASGDEYLMVKYDGPNYGTEVWYIGGLTGMITIPAFPPSDKVGQYGISGYALFTTFTTTITNHVDVVPDAGSTALLLGAVMSGLGMMVRRIPSVSESVT